MQVVIVQILANENHLANARLAFLPWLLAGAEIDLIVHTLEDELGVTLVRKSKNTLAAVDICCLSLQQRGHEGVELRDIQQAFNGETHGRHQRQVVRLLLLFLGLLFRVSMFVFVLVIMFVLLVIMAVLVMMLVLMIVMIVLMLVTVTMLVLMTVVMT